MSDGNGRLLLPDEAAAVLKVSRRVLLQLARDEELRAIKVGRYWRFRRDWLDEYVEARGAKR